jgi:hypothetical protein
VSDAALRMLLLKCAELELRTGELEIGYVRLAARLGVTTDMVKSGGVREGSVAYDERMEQAELAALEHFQTTGKFRGRR